MTTASIYLAWMDNNIYLHRILSATMYYELGLARLYKFFTIVSSLLADALSLALDNGTTSTGTSVIERARPTEMRIVTLSDGLDGA